MPQVVHTEIRRQRDARLNQICAAGTKQSETESEQVENEAFFWQKKSFFFSCKKNGFQRFKRLNASFCVRIELVQKLKPVL